MSYSAEIIGVGTELLLGEIVNSDAQIISQGLSELGVNVFYHTVVGDNQQRLQAVIELAKTRSDIIITTGGLGPTYDDLTKETIAMCFGKRLIVHDRSRVRLLDFFKKTGCSMPENNDSQAMIPEDSIVLENDWGTAPGIIMEHGGKHIIMLPGPVAECSMMFQFRVIPYLEKITNRIILSKSVKIFGMGESAVDKILSPMMADMKNPTVAPYAKNGEVLLRVTASAVKKEEALALIEPVVDNICSKLGDVVYGVDVENLESVVLQLLKKSGKKLVVAESCTGGLLAKRLTDIPGASENFLGGICSYDNNLKTGLLGVEPQIIETDGAVSESVARSMAEGMRRLTGADFSIGITGLAGPGAATNPSKPIGTVFIALAAEGFCECSRFSLWGNRARIRNVAASHALDILRKHLIN